MPFCTKCKYEYVEGIKTCSDCGLKLVPELHDEQKPVAESLDLVVLASFMFPVEAEMAKTRLDREGIESILSGEIVTTTMWPGLDPFPLRLMVRREDFQRAREVLDSKKQE